MTVLGLALGEFGFQQEGIDASNAFVAGQAKLGVYNLTTGAKIAMIDLAAADTAAAKDAKHFANDVAAGSDGSAYITDTLAQLHSRPARQAPNWAD